MKLTQSLILLAAGAVTLLALAGCSQATSDTVKSTAPAVPTSISLSFTKDADQFTSDASWAADSIDLTTGVQTINVYAGSHDYTPSATVDLSKATTFSVDIKGDVKVNSTSTGNSGWWFSGFRVVLVDKNGNKFDFKDVLDTTDFNNTSYTTVTRTFTETGAKWEGTTAGDLSKIATVRIYTNYNVGSLTLKNLSIQ
jgi:hypothetical protein